MPDNKTYTCEPTGSNEDYNSTTQECMSEQKAVVENSNCTYSSIELTKDGGDHKQILIIEPFNTKDTKSLTYSVVSGQLGGAGQSELYLRVYGIHVENCKHQHENQVVTIIDPSNPKINQTADNKFVTGFQYGKFSDLLMSWKKPVMKFPILVQSCQAESHIEIVTYSDLKFEISLKVTLSIGSDGGINFNFDGSGALSCDNDNAKVTVELGYEKELDNSKKSKSLDKKLSLKFDVKSGSLSLGFNSEGGSLKELARSPVGGLQDFVQIFQDFIRIPTIIHNGVEKTFDVLLGLTKVSGKLKKSAPKYKWKLSKDAKIDAAVYWMEDPDSFEVGRLLELKVSGLIFGASWTWNFTDIVLNLIPWVGKIISYINNQTIEHGIGGIVLEIGCSGEARLNDAYQYKILIIRGISKKLKTKDPSLKCDLNISLKATGMIQINPKTMYLANGEATTGVTAEISGGAIVIYNNALVIKSVISVVKCGPEKATETSNIGYDILPPNCKMNPENNGASYTVFKEKEIFNFK